MIIQKVSLRNQLESEFQAKLDKERQRMGDLEDMSKSDKKKAISQALVESNKERDQVIFLDPASKIIFFYVV